MLPKIKVFFLMFLMFFFVQGCSGAQEVDDLGYILLMGIDKGEENILTVTFQLAIPQSVETQEKSNTTEVVVIEAASIYGATQLLNTFISKHVTLIHNVAIIVSEEIAREGLKRYINPFVRSRDLRRTTFLFVTKGTAKDFIKKNRGLVFEEYPSRQIDVFMEAAALTGFILESDVHDFYQAWKSPGRQPTTALVGVQRAEGKENPRVKAKSDLEMMNEEMNFGAGEVPRQGGNQIEVIGQAVFKDDKLVGFLTGIETCCYKILSGNFKKGLFVIPDFKGSEHELIEMEIIKGSSPKIKIKPGTTKTLIEVNLFLKGEILSIQSGINYEASALEQELEAHVSSLISQKTTQLIKKTQREFKSDIFGFGEYTRGLFWTWQEWVDYAWLDQYPYCEVKVNTDFVIRRVGMMLNTVPDV